MDLITEPHAMAHRVAQARRQHPRIGFVPTMGALHQGHLGLVERAKEENDLVVCSIFVNPLQFNDPQDLARYPRTPGEDRALLESVGCDLLFSPEKESLLLDFQPHKYDLGGLDHHWEGPSRPGHFQGVVNVVDRLFFFVRPDNAYFGEKDRQQLMILQHVGRNEHWPVRIVPCPTAREKDGLALSSRNLRLSPHERQVAAILAKALDLARNMAFARPIHQVDAAVRELLAPYTEVRLDHFGIAHPDTLHPLKEWGDLDSAIGIIAAQIGPVRLIDNVTLRRT